MRILIDMNLLLRIADPQHTHHDSAALALELLRDHGHELRTVPQNTYEYWVVATRPLAQNGLGSTPRETSSHLERVRYFFPLLRDERAVLEQWEQLAITHGV